MIDSNSSLPFQALSQGNSAIPVIGISLKYALLNVHLGAGLKPNGLFELAAGNPFIARCAAPSMGNLGQIVVSLSLVIS